MIGRWCNKCKASWSVKKYPRLRKCPKCGSPLGDVYRVEAYYKRKRVSRIVYGTLADARRYEIEIKRRLQFNEPLPDEEVSSKIPLKDFMEKRYLPWLKEERPNSYRAEASFWKNHILPLLGSRPIGELNPLDAERLKKAIKDKGLSPRMVEKGLQLLRKALNKAKKWKVLPESYENPVKFVDFPKFDNKKRRVIKPEEIKLILETLKEKNIWVYGACLLALYTGLRRKEILSLRWQDIDFKRGVILLPWEKDPEARVIPVIEEVLEFLKTLPRGRPQDPVFLVHPDTVTHTFQEVVEELGLNQGIKDRRYRLTFHSLRHSFCTALAMKKIPLEIALRLSRHKTTTMFKRYEHLAGELLKEEAEKIKEVYPVEKLF